MERPSHVGSAWPHFSGISFRFFLLFQHTSSGLMRSFAGRRGPSLSEVLARSLVFLSLGVAREVGIAI